MADGSEKQRLNHYLSGAREEAIGSAGKDWQSKGKLLRVVSEALRDRGPELAERLGKDSQTATQLRAALLKASSRMLDTSAKLGDAGDALVAVGDNIEKARVLRTAMKTLVEPPAFVEPTYAGAQPTPDQILDAANKRAASNKEHGDYKAASNGQEADAAEIVAKLDDVFLSAIPPMMAIHGGPDTTKRKKTKEGGQLVLVGTTGETDGERRRRKQRERAEMLERKERAELRERELERQRQERMDREREAEAEREREREREAARERQRTLEEQARQDRLERLERERLERERLEQQREREHHTPVPVETSHVEVKHVEVKHVESTNVTGGADGGITYQGTESSASASAHASDSAAASKPGSSTLGSSLGVGAAVAGGTAAAVRGGGMALPSGVAMSTPSGSVSAGSPSAAIGAGSRTGAPSSLGSTASSAGSPTRAAGASTPGSSAAGGSRSAGSPSGRSSGGSGKSKGLFRRGSNGSTTGGRRGKKDERSDQREALVYDQDWLGDDDAAPSVLD